MTKVDYILVDGREGMEEIDAFRQTASCFPASEINPAIGCSYGCTYCSMYGQKKEMTHNPMRVHKEYPDYLREFLENCGDSVPVFNLSPKTDFFAPPLIDSGVSKEILEALRDYQAPFYIITKSGMPDKEIFDILKQTKDHGQIIISSGLVDEEYRRILEPNAPCIDDRMDFAKTGINEGITVTGIVAPYLPFGKDYAEQIFARYVDAGVRHLSVHLLKASKPCFDRMCASLPEHEEKLKGMFSNVDETAIDWKLPDGDTVTRYYPDIGFMKKEFEKLSNVAERTGVTLSACKDVVHKIGNPPFNEISLKKGYTCVGYFDAGLIHA